MSASVQAAERMQAWGVGKEAAERAVLMGTLLLSGLGVGAEKGL